MLLIVCSLSMTACQTAKSSTPEETKKTSIAKIYDRLGMAYLEAHDIHRAKQKFIMALEKAPDIPEPWYSMGYFLETTGNREKAKEYYLKAVQLAPTRGDVLNNYGTFLCRSGEYKTAVGYFIKAAQDTKYLEQASAYENAGLCSLKIPDQKLAMAYFNKTLEEDPSRSKALLELSELNYQKGKYDLARIQLTKYLQLAKPSSQSYLLEKKLDKKLQA